MGFRGTLASHHCALTPSSRCTGEALSNARNVLNALPNTLPIALPTLPEPESKPELGELCVRALRPSDPLPRITTDFLLQIATNGHCPRCRCF